MHIRLVNAPALALTGFALVGLSCAQPATYETGDTGHSDVETGGAVPASGFADAVSFGGSRSHAERSALSRGPQGSVVFEQALPEAASNSWLATVQASIEISNYVAHPSSELSYRSVNPSQQFTTDFAPGSASVASRDGAVVAVALAGWGREDSWQPVEPVAPLLGDCAIRAPLDPAGVCVARVEYQRPGLVEWWENVPAGLEQGFTVLAAPESSGLFQEDSPLVFSIRVHSAVAEVDADGSGATLHRGEGEGLRYDGLVAWDDTGRELPSWMEESEWGLNLYVDDSTAIGRVHVDPILTTAAWSVDASSFEGIGFGYSVSGAGDVNADGFADVVVGSIYYSGGQTEEGGVWLYLGAHAGPATTAAWSGQGGIVSAQFGAALASAGDTNGDGLSDLIVGAPGLASSFVYYGMASSPYFSPTSTKLVGGVGTSGFSVAGGDINGDGYADVLMGDPTAQGQRGAIYAFFGSSGGVTTATPWFKLGGTATSQQGTGVALADVNGDGYADVLGGAPNHVGGGRLYVYYGSAAGVSSSSSEANAPMGGTEFASDVGNAGDVNGDGVADVVVARASSQEVFIYYGSVGGLVTSSPAVSLTNSAGGYGSSSGSAGDVNGDGYADVFVGARDAGAVFMYYGSATGLATAVGATISSSGASGAAAGDVNGDGFGDLIIGDEISSANLYYGAPSAISTSSFLSLSAVGVSGFGTSVASAGDVNADGYADAVVGVPGSGMIYVYPGTSIGLSSTALWSVSIGSGSAGFSVTGLDVKNDGYSDIVVGLPDGSSGAGQVYLYSATSSGIAAVTSWSSTGSASTGALGTSVARAGDINGDGFADLLVGAPGHTGSQTGEGALFVYHGSASGLGASPNATRVSGVAGAALGTSVAAAGDVNRDGFGDVLAGSPSNAAGKVYLFEGSTLGIAAMPAQTLTGEASGGKFGVAVASAGDVNGDGFADVVVGADNLSNGHSAEGKAYVFLGGAGGLGTTSGWAVESNVMGANLGGSLSSAGDVNGDGFGDVIVGARCGSVCTSGFAQLYLGSSAGLATVAAATMTDTGRFGVSVASLGDTNGDGFGEVIVGNSTASSGAGYARVFYGNSADGTAPGLSRRAVVMSPSSSTYLAPSAGSNSSSAFDAAIVSARGPWGRSRVALQVEVATTGTLFSGSGLHTSSIVSSGTSGVAITKAITGLSPGTGYHWRARIKAAPSEAQPLGWTPWFYGGMQGDAHGVHVQTGGSAATPPSISSALAYQTVSTASTYTTSPSVFIAFAATDSVGVTQYCIDESGTCSSWLSVPSPPGVSPGNTWTVPYILSSGNGLKTVYVRVRNAAGMTSALPASDTILLDSQAPLMGSSVFSADAGNTQVTLSYDASQFTDPESNGYSSGVGTLVARWAVGAAAPECAGAVSGDSITLASSPYVHTGRTNGATYNYRLCQFDNAGNVVSQTASAVPAAAPSAFSQTVAVTEDSFSDITLTGSDTGNLPLTFAIGAGPIAGATLEAQGTVRNIAGTQSQVWRYTPKLNHNGGDSFTFTTTNGTSTSAGAAVTINVSAVNDAPTATGGTGLVTEDVNLSLSLVGADVDGDVLSYQIVSSPAHGLLTGTNTSSWTYDPDLNYHGSDSFTFRAYDGAAYSSTVTQSVTVSAVNDTPVAYDYSTSTTLNAPVVVVLSGSDVEGAVLTAVPGPATNGTVAYSGGSWHYTPNSGYSGSDAFTFVVQEPTGTPSSAPATVTVDVSSNAAPVLSATSVNADTLYTTSSSVSVTFSATDESVASQYCISETPTCTEWASLPTPTSGTATNGSWSVPYVFGPSGDGARTVYLKLRDPGMAQSNQQSDGIILDTTSPVGTLNLMKNGSSVDSTNSTALSFQLSSVEANGLAEYCLSNSAECTGTWTPYPVGSAAPVAVSWTLPSLTASSYTVSAFVKDSAGNIGTVVKVIVVDTTRPTEGTFSVTGGVSQQLTLEWGAAADAVGVTGYKVVFVVAPAAVPADCNSGTLLATLTNSDRSYIHTFLVNGSLYTYRLCAFDGAGNLSVGKMLTRRPAPEYDPPVTTIQINADAAYTTSRTVTVSVTGTDASGIQRWCLGEAPTCASWTTLGSAISPHTVSQTFTLSSSNGTKRVYHHAMDAMYNVSLPVSDAIVYDNVAPSPPTLTLVASSAGTLSASWTASTDATSGIKEYRVVSGTSSPANCSSGATTQTSLSKEFTDLNSGTTYFVRVCPVDQAGNVGAGSVKSQIAKGEFNVPVASGGTSGLTVSNVANFPSDVEFVSSLSVKLSISVTDASNVAAYCLTNTTTCSRFLSISPPAGTWNPSGGVPWTLAAGSGSKTVRLFLRDSLGNQSVLASALSDSVTLDVSTPIGGSLTLTASSTVGSRGATAEYSAFSDGEGSGITSYKIAYVRGTTYPSSGCRSGTVQTFSGTAASGARAFTTLLAGQHSVRLCPVDAMGNVGAGRTGRVTVL